MKFKDKVPIEIDFGEHKIELEKEFPCPKCDAKVKVNKNQLLNKASNVVKTVPILYERNKLIKTYNEKPEKFSDYFDFAAKLAKLDKKLDEIVFASTSMSISYELGCGHRINVRVFSDIEPLKPPKKQEALRKLGLNSPNAWRWLSHIYSPDGRIDESLGKRRAAEIMEIVNNYFKETEAFRGFEKEMLTKLPHSVTDLDRRIKAQLQRDIKEVLEELKTLMNSVVHDIEEALTRVSFRPEQISPNRGSYAIHAGD